MIPKGHESKCHVKLGKRGDVHKHIGFLNMCLFVVLIMFSQAPLVACKVPYAWPLESSK